MSLYSQSLLIFIHKNPVVSNHPTKGEIREFIRPRSTPTGITIYFYMSSSLIYILEIHRRKFQNVTSDEDIVMENDYMFVMLRNLSAISHLIFPQCFSFISCAKSKNNLRLRSLLKEQPPFFF